jgi:thioredoxin reductase
MSEQTDRRRPLRRTTAIVAAGCAGLAAAVMAARRRGAGAAWFERDPPDSALSEDEMESLATAEGMPEPPER